MPAVLFLFQIQNEILWMLFPRSIGIAYCHCEGRLGLGGGFAGTMSNFEQRYPYDTRFGVVVYTLAGSHLSTTTELHFAAFTDAVENTTTYGIVAK
jgi:hypothetical protein